MHNAQGTGGRPSWWLLIVLATAGGCGGANKPVPVHGVVLLDGRPLAGATITFVPDSPGTHEAHAYSTADGSFKLSTYRPADGAVPGEYKVLVSYTEPTPGLSASATQEEAMQAMEKATRAGKRPLLILPDKYTNPAKTQLRQKVPPDGVVRLELRTKD